MTTCIHATNQVDNYLCNCRETCHPMLLITAATAKKTGTASFKHCGGVSGLDEARECDSLCQVEARSEHKDGRAKSMSAGQHKCKFDLMSLNRSTHDVGISARAFA